MASKNAVVQSSRKATRSTSQGSTTVSAASGRVMTRSTAKPTASSAREQAIVTATSKSPKVPNGDSKIAGRVFEAKTCCQFQHATDDSSRNGWTPNPHQSHLPALQLIRWWVLKQRFLSVNIKWSTVFSCGSWIFWHCCHPGHGNRGCQCWRTTTSTKATVDRLSRESTEKDIQIKCQNE